MSREILQNIIENFSPDKFPRFFRDKNRFFSPHQETYSQYDDEFFADGLKLGEIKFSDSERLITCAFQSTRPLSERSSRKAQYEKGKKILKNTQSDAGIFVFYDAQGNFRFSLIYPEAVGTRRQWSNFRRFTYFVSNEPDVTNKTFLQRIGGKPEDGTFSSLAKIKESFSLSAVTDIFYNDFFIEYNKLVEAVKKCNKISDEEKARDYVLLFVIRTIFVGFIQKRGWIGNNEKFIPDLLKEYLKSATEKEAFYEKWLSVLFFESFNKKFSPRKYFSQRLNADFQMAPYLNGGLFQQKPGYDDQGYSIPDKDIISFFDFLFSHNFTIEENSYEDEDLQLNPEFLGIIFERLVNKADGAVYTPRTEVDLMCRLSLIKWLEKSIALPVSKNNLYELFFREGKEDSDQKHGSFSEREIKELLGHLENITICDPAVGSGAFLVGIMQVLDEIEQSLKARIHLKDDDAFERKKRIIAQSLYGVEVKEWAVWICQLRLWLSLFIEAPDEMKNSFHPILPSLDFKVRQGDSLVQRIGSKAFPVLGHAMIGEGVKRKVTQLKNLKNEYFGHKTPMKDWEIRQRELAIYDEILQSEISEKTTALNNLKNIKPQKQLTLYGAKEEPEQTELNFNQEKIEHLESEIQELKDQKHSMRKDKPLVWNIEFAEIFVENGGFDVVIGNPPYVRQEDIADPTGRIKDKKEYKNYLQEMVRLDFPADFPPKVKINAQSDLYTYFYIRALRLLNPKGIHTFICSNSWLDVGYGVWLQKFLLDRASVEFIIDNHVKRSFEVADVNTIISIIHAPVKKSQEEHQVRFVAFKRPFEETVFTEYLLQIEEAKKIISDDILRVYPVLVKDLIDTGSEYESETQKKMGGGVYVGDKWGGKYLRAPDIFFTILRKGGILGEPGDDKQASKQASKQAENSPTASSGSGGGAPRDHDRSERVLLSGGRDRHPLRLAESKLVRLGDIAEVRFGIKTGANEFFYLEDVTDSDMKFVEIKSQIKNLGNLKSLTEIKRAGLRICQNQATGDYWLIEENFLKSVIKSPRESKSILVKEKCLKLRMFLCPEGKKKLSKTRACDYVEWGEDQKFHKRPSCSGRPRWYDLGSKEFWPILWPMIHNDRLAAFLNIDKVAVDHNLFEIKANNPDREAITVFSLLTVLFRELYGRSNLGEGALKTEGIDIVKFMVLNPNAFSDWTYKRLKAALATLAKREIKSVFEETGIDPRRKIRDQEPNPLKDRQIFEDILFDELSLTKDERCEVYWSVCELVKNRLDKAGSV